MAPAASWEDSARSARISPGRLQRGRIAYITLHNSAREATLLPRAWRPRSVSIWLEPCTLRADSYSDLVARTVLARLGSNGRTYGPGVQTSAH